MTDIDDAARLDFDEVSSMETIRVMLACNEAYAMPMTIAAHSALSQIGAERSVEIHIIADGVTPESRARSEHSLKKAHPQVTVIWRKADLTDMTGVNYRHYSAASLIRVLMPRLFDEKAQKVLYLDSDVVVTGDVSALFDMDLKGKAIWAVQDGADEEFANRIGSKFPWINAPADARYFNSGVLMVNLAEWRKTRVTERVLDFLQDHHEELSFPDQDALNAVALGDWGRLSASWNMQPIHYNWRIARRLNAPGIIHFTCCKPWDRDYTWSGKLQYHKAYLASSWDSRPRAFLNVLRVYPMQVLLQSKGRVIRVTRRLLGLRAGSQV